jgi:hypothetical protein
MTLESAIDAAVRQANRGTKKSSVVDWNWHERDVRRCRNQWIKGLGLLEEEIKILYAFIGDPYDIADAMIIEASVAECLTSSSEYIRERKRLFLKENI